MMHFMLFIRYRFHKIKNTKFVMLVDLEFRIKNEFSNKMGKKNS